MVRNIFKAFFWLLILALLVMPLGLIYQISLDEMEEYAPAESPIIRQTSIGAPAQALRQNLDIYVTVSGRFTSDSIAFMELNYRRPYQTRWIVGYGDEIQVDQILGYQDGKEVISTVEGVIENISTSDGNAYIMVRTFEPLVLECQVDDQVLSSLEAFPKTLALSDGTSVTLVRTMKQRKSDGTITIQLQLEREGDSYGEAVEDMNIFLGASYPQVLTLPAKCLYQKNPGDEEPWYVREVTEDGIFVREQQVTISYRSGSLVVVDGVEEGAWFDTGYGAVMEGDEV